MNKRIVIMLLALLAVLSATAAYGEETATATYTVEEAEMEITLPGDWLVLTQQSSEGDPAFTELGLDYRQTMKRFEKMGIYLAATALNSGFEMNLLLGKDVRTFDYNLYSDEALQTIVDATVAQTAQDQENRNIVYTEGSVYQHAQAKFMVLDGYRSDLDAYVRQYGTVINGLAVSLVFGRYNGQTIDEGALQQIQTIVDSISFAEVKEPSNSAVKLAEEFNQDPLAAVQSRGNGMNWLLAVVGVALVLGSLYLLIRYRRQRRR